MWKARSSQCSDGPPLLTLEVGPADQPAECSICRMDNFCWGQDVMPFLEHTSGKALITMNCANNPLCTD